VFVCVPGVEAVIFVSGDLAAPARFLTLLNAVGADVVGLELVGG
jgi:hypothetical protein